MSTKATEEVVRKYMQSYLVVMRAIQQERRMHGYYEVLGCNVSDVKPMPLSNYRPLLLLTSTVQTAMQLI